MSPLHTAPVTASHAHLISPDAHPARSHAHPTKRDAHLTASDAQLTTRDAQLAKPDAHGISLKRMKKGEKPQKRRMLSNACLPIGGGKITRSPLS